MKAPQAAQAGSSNPQLKDVEAEPMLSHSIASEIGDDLPSSVQERLEGIQMLLRYEGTEHYSQMQQKLATKLGISVRSVQRMVKAWREEGIRGLKVKTRRDCGDWRISEEWQRFI